MMGTGVLEVVGTPIGNLDDISQRALDTLGSADIILAEDTRVTARLLARFSISVPLMRADEHVIGSRVQGVIERLEAGQRVALVSDAGMPCVSDPGQRLVDAVLDAGQRVEVIPGPSSVTSALALSGLRSDHFFFEGFLPRKDGARRRRLETLAKIPATLVILESPRRVVGCVRAIASVMPGRRVALCRELTKVHEECVRGQATELADILEARGEILGECVVVVEGPDTDELVTDAPAMSLEEAIESALAAGESKSALAKRLARTYGIARGEAYEAVLAHSRTRA